MVRLRSVGKGKQVRVPMRRRHEDPDSEPEDKKKHVSEDVFNHPKKQRTVRIAVTNAVKQEESKETKPEGIHLEPKEGVQMDNVGEASAVPIDQVVESASKVPWFDLNEHCNTTSTGTPSVEILPLKKRGGLK